MKKQTSTQAQLKQELRNLGKTLRLPNSSAQTVFDLFEKHPKLLQGKRELMSHWEQYVQGYQTLKSLGSDLFHEVLLAQPHASQRAHISAWQWSIGGRLVQEFTSDHPSLSMPLLFLFLEEMPPGHFQTWYKSETISTKSYIEEATETLSPEQELFFQTRYVTDQPFEYFHVHQSTQGFQSVQDFRVVSMDADNLPQTLGFLERWMGKPWLELEDLRCDPFGMQIQKKFQKHGIARSRKGLLCFYQETLLGVALVHRCSEAHLSFNSFENATTLIVNPTLPQSLLQACLTQLMDSSAQHYFGKPTIAHHRNTFPLFVPTLDGRSFKEWIGGHGADWMATLYQYGVTGPGISTLRQVFEDYFLGRTLLHQMKTQRRNIKQALIQ